MTAFLAKLERFESLAAECELIARRSGGGERELYQRLAKRYRDLAIDMRTLIATFDVAA
ncbi:MULTISPECIES: hypothetical protein [unclassified Bradyrhizobium]|uniref:hypothetical protein n=1 Tax=unclassified Bradyrhizobium TaxID=2631580 RepID=UPI002479730A|nr:MULTISPECIES: hypothetical protein [unclassified Bradyrhizobium]WGR67919.1 hypothetical protein MTX24_20875 [Bradyrhizobium sp. ISRA426]WGR79972.1 hypothetical protein MTX21_05990 [Bradyrhizobium sp. ISRA430]WGR83158.1 hypothetical protein MTX25_20555 [Bradyrhizobium sp. ISRA432]